MPNLRPERDLNDHLPDIPREDHHAGRHMIGRRITSLLDCALADLAPCAAPPDRPEDLLAHRCRARTIKGRPVCWKFGPPGQVTRLEITAALHFSTHQPCIAAAKAGLGIAYAVPRAQVAADLASGALVELLPGQVTPLPPLMVYYSSRRHVPPKLAAFLAVLTEVGQSQAV